MRSRPLCARSCRPRAPSRCASRPPTRSVSRALAARSRRTSRSTSSPSSRWAPSWSAAPEWPSPQVRRRRHATPTTRAAAPRRTPLNNAPRLRRHLAARRVRAAGRRRHRDGGRFPRLLPAPAGAHQVRGLLQLDLPLPRRRAPLGTPPLPARHCCQATDRRAPGPQYWDNFPDTLTNEGVEKLSIAMLGVAGGTSLALSFLTFGSA